MKQEFSAGGVVFRQAQDFGSKPQFSKNIEVLLCQHSYHHGWVFPKGLIGPSAGSGRAETKEEAALREVTEETGAIGKILQSLSPVSYWYMFEKEKRKKTVYYFLMEFVGGDITQHDHEMENVEWLPIEGIEKRLSYKSDKKVWAEAKKILIDNQTVH